MEYAAQSIMKRRRILKNFSLLFLAVAIFLTFFSKTIDAFLLPEVSASSVKSGALVEALEFEGEIVAEDIEYVRSGGEWRVLEVVVKPGSEVEEGSRLLRVDTADMLMKLKKKELEVLACENDLERYKAAYGGIDLSPYKRDMERAVKEVGKCEGNLERTRELYEAGAVTLVAVTELEDELENLKAQYDVSAEAFEKKEKEMSLSAVEHERMLREKTLELDIKKLELEELKKSMPSEEGYLESRVKGQVKAVAVGSGANTFQGQELFEIIKTGTPLSAKWAADPLKSDSVNEEDEITLIYQRGGKSAVMYGKILTKTYLLKEKEYEFVSRLDSDRVKLGEGEEDEVLLREGDTLTVHTTKRSEDFRFIVPSGSIKKEMDTDVVYVIREREGALGKELFVEAVRVGVLKSNGNDSAVEGSLGKDDRVVTYSTKPLMNGARVKLK